jgi:hypothetical protein
MTHRLIICNIDAALRQRVARRQLPQLAPPDLQAPQILALLLQDLPVVGGRALRALRRAAARRAARRVGLRAGQGRGRGRLGWSVREVQRG